MIRIPIELQPYLTYTEAGLEEVKPVPQELRKEAEDLRESYRVAHDPSNLSEYKEAVMSEPRMMYDCDSLKMHGLKSDVSMWERHIHHELDNFAMDMSPELQSILKDLEKDLRKANKALKEIQ